MSRRILIAYGLLLFVLLLLRTAWLSDHAYLALRTADNAAWGLGFRWNVAERAQVFDHPLWMLCLYLARVATGEVYYGTLVLSMACATAATWLVLRQAVTDAGAVVAALALALSPTFLTYSTSGLGTPLVHLLVTSIVVLAVRDVADATTRRRVSLAVLGTLAALTDPTTLLLTLPVLLVSGGRFPLVAVPLVAVGAWTAVAAWYYGSIVPLSLLARLNQGVTAGERLQAGARFAADAVARDPILAAALVIGLALPFFRRTPERLVAACAIAAAAVVLGSGGSTWSGYGLTMPFVVAVVVLARQPRRAAAAGALAATAVLAVVTPVHTTASHAQYGLAAPRTAGIVDPRLQDYQATGLLRVRRNQWFPDDPESARGLRAGESRQPIASSPRPGFFGYAAGRAVHVVDATGLGDPLLARLPPHVPAAPGQPVLDLRPRRPPDGYLQSLIENRNLLTDPALAAFYDRVRFVTRSRLEEDGRAVSAVRLAFEGDAGP